MPGLYDPVGAPPSAGGGVGLRFDAGGDKREVGTPTWLQISPPLTLALWLMPLGTPQNNAGFFGVVHNNTDTAPASSYLWDYSGSVYRYNFNSSGSQNLSDTTIAPTTGALTHLCATMTTGGGVKYVDGVSNGTFGGVTTIAYGATTLLFAGDFTNVNRNSNSLFIDGRIWNRALSAGEVFDLYAGNRWDLYWRPSTRTMFNIAAAGRTTKNTRGWPLGVEIGMGWRLPA